MRRRLLASALGAAALLASGSARALDPEITSDTTAQFYDVRSPSGQTIVPRRRLTSTLGVATYDLLPRPSMLSPDAATAKSGVQPELLFRARLRYDADYGAHPGEASSVDYDRLVPGFSRGPVDLMYGYLEGRRLFGGWFGFKLGRQYTTDALGWWSFDGASVRATTPYFFAVEALGGMEVRGGLPLSTPRWERDGVWRGDRSGYDASLYPSFQPSEVAPAIGAAVESAGFTLFHGRLSYRRVYNTGASNVSSFASGLTQPISIDGTRISQERVGYALDASKAELGGLKAGFAYDLYAARLSSIFASVDAYATERLTLSADYDFYAPTYDGDSIWNFFAGNPMNDVALRAAWEVTDSVAVSGGGNMRVFQEETAPSNATTSLNLVPDASLYPSIGASFDGGGFVAARRHRGMSSEGIRANAAFGHEGHRAGGELFAEHVVFGRTVVLGRASVFDWADRLRPGREATSLGLVAGLGYRMSERSRAQLELSMDTNRLVGVRSRVVLWFTVAAR